MASILQDLWPGSRSEESRMLRNYSLNEFALLAGTYKHMFKEQLRQPSAENNHIINYNLKLQNFLIINSSLHMISAGMFTFLVKSLIGNGIDRITLNYLGARKQVWAQVIIYVFVFYSSFNWLNSSKRLNVNHLINPRDFNGEIMMNLTLKYFPLKVNQDKYRQALMAKYEGQLIKITSFEQMMGGGPEHYKLANPGAVSTLINQGSPNPNMGGQGFPGGGMGMGGMSAGMAAMPGGLQIAGLPQIGHPGSITNPAMLGEQAQQPQGPPSPHHAQDNQLKRIIQQSQQDQTNAQIALANPQVPQQTVPTQAQGQTQPSQPQAQELESQRSRIVDQLRAQQQVSPYLSTNPLLTPTQAMTSSPYLSVQQEIQKSSGYQDPQKMQEAMNSYYIQNISELQHLQQQQQGTGYRYQGHYFNVAQQAKKDSS